MEAPTRPAGALPEASPLRPSPLAVALVALALVNFAIKYLTSIVLANTLGIEAFERYAVAIASVVFFSTVVELGLGKQGIRLLPEYLEREDTQRAAGYWRFAMRTVLLVSIATALLVILSHELLPATAAHASDAAMYLLPIVALTGLGAELVVALGAAGAATVVVRVLVPVVPLGFVAWASLSAFDLVPEVAIVAYGAGWVLGLAVLLAVFAVVCPREVLRGPSEFDTRAWVKGGLGFLGLAVAISALLDGTVALAEWADVPSADISIYAVCIETGGFVLILVKSLDKFYLQRISALVTRGDLAEIHRIRRRRAALMLVVCSLFCLGIIVWGRPLLRSFGPGFERGYFSLCCVAIATSAWTLTALSQWLIAFTDGPVPAMRISLLGVFATFTAILLLGPSQGLLGVALSYSVMVGLMSILLELRARRILRDLVRSQAGE